MILVASNSLSFEAWASSSTVRCPLARARSRSSSGCELAVAGALPGHVDAAVGDALPEVLPARRSSGWRPSAGSGWRAGRRVPVFSSGSWSTRVNAPSRARTMAWKMSETCWVTHAQRSCGCSSPRSTSARPTRLGGLSRSASSTSWRAAWPIRTSTSLRRSAGILAARAVDLAVLEDDGALSAGRVEPKRACPAGLAEEGDEVRERKAGRIADEDDAGSLAPSALGRLAERGEEVRSGRKEDEAAVARSQLARGLAIGSDTPSGLHADAGGHGRLPSLTGWPWSRCRVSSASRARRRR